MNINIYPNPSDLRYFQEIASTENISRAAERLGVGQPALSLSLKRLEDQLQVQLFSRRNRGLKLTDAGARLLRECNRLLSDWESVVSETRKSEIEVRGKYRLGCHPSVALYSLDPFVKDLYQAHTGIELQLVHGLSRVICEGVISGKIDFGLVINPVSHPELVIVELAKDEVTFWRNSKGLPNVLLCNPDLFQTQSLLKKARRMNFQRTVASESLEVLASLAKSNAGTAILPERVVKILAPSLTKVAGAPSFQDRLTLVYRFDLRKTAGAKVILEGLKSLSSRL